jgi:hypothetical protein
MRIVKTINGGVYVKMEEQRVTTSLKIKSSIRDKFKVYCIEKKIDMSELLEKLIEKEMKK